MEKIDSEESSNPEVRNNPSIGVGIVAAFVTLTAVLCCAGVPLLLSFVGAIGLGVLVKKHLLFPLMVGSLLLGSWGAWRSWRTHRDNGILVGYLASALAIPLGMKLYQPVMYAGLIGLLLLTGGDLVRKLRHPAVCAIEKPSPPKDKTDCPVKGEEQ
ncbi:MAG: MerC domain-containing protein [Nitrospirota bacterium]|nr:MerC domain-containing protein [Nitrospirota bacterium]